MTPLPDSIEPLIDDAPVHSHAVRRLRYMRQCGLSDGQLERMAEIMAIRLGLDTAKIIAESKFPGPTNGFPFLAEQAARRKQAKRSDDHA